MARIGVGDAVDFAHQIVRDEDGVTVAVELVLVVPATLDYVVDMGGRILVGHRLFIQRPHIHRAPPLRFAISSWWLWHKRQGVRTTNCGSFGSHLV
jgi:hypothetical protein